jgi:hypothetical protein
MAQFATETRRWLESAVKQRKLLLRMNKSHKNPAQTEMAIARLELQLKTYTYENDLYMARFIRNFYNDIDLILPGVGSTSHLKKQLQFKDINSRAILIASQKINQPQTQPIN